MPESADLFAAVPIELIPVASVQIPPERQRDAPADETLINSIRERGLINPIIVREGNLLMAGGRRLDAHRQLQWPLIAARRLENLSPLAIHLLELDENLARKNLSWQEEVRAIAAYHALRVADFPAWTQQGTASDVGLSNQYISRILVVARHLTDPDVAGAHTFVGAFNLIEGRADRALAAAQSRGLLTADDLARAALPTISADASKEERTDALLAALDDDFDNVATSTTTLLDKFEAADAATAALRDATAVDRTLAADDRILHDSFLSWAPDYTGPLFDVLHCDFPYGKNYAGSNTRRTGRATIAPTYGDSADIYFALVDCLLENQDRLLLPSAHCIFWFDMMHYNWTIEQFTSAGWRLVQPYPLIWTKNYQGVASDPQRRPRHCYETALMFSRGDRRIRRLDQDIHEERVSDDKLHISAKPIAMLRHFLQLVVDEHTAVLDPTCGSGSALIAAGQLGAPRVLGIELEESNVDIARFNLSKELP